MKILNHLKSQSIAIFYSGQAPKKSADQKYAFEVNRNFYYLTHINQENSYLMVIKGVITKTILFIEKRSKERILWEGEVLSFEEAKRISGVDEVYPNDYIDTYLRMTLSSTRQNQFGKIETIYFDFEAGLGKMEFEEEYSHKLLKSYPYLTIENLHLDLAHLRSIKSKQEIKAIEKAIEITKEGILLMMKKAKVGMYEYELEAYYAYTLKKHNVKPSFHTIAASGVNGTILHYETNNKKTQKDDLILFDLGVYYQNYASDISRTFPVGGRFTPTQRKYYDLVLKCNKLCIEAVKPGLTWKALNDYAKDILSEGLIKLGLIQEKEELFKYYYHSIGHFLGLDVHDVGDYTKPLQEGQILTIEPGLYIKEEGIGIRIEDNILVTKNGHINLSSSIIKEADEIEAFMTSTK